MDSKTALALVQMLTSTLWFLGVVLLVFLGSWIYYPALMVRRPVRDSILTLTIGVVCVVPLIVPPALRFTRWLSAIVAVMGTLHLVDIHLGSCQGRRPSPQRFALLLVKMIGFVERSPKSWSKLSGTDERRKFLICTFRFLVGLLMFILCYRVDWTQALFLVEHTVKVGILFLWLVPATNALASLVRLTGGAGLDIMRNPAAAYSPADFWRRYNRPLNHFFSENVYRLLGGIEKPWKATLVVFMISGILHEYVFFVPIGQVQGIQLLFFLIQGVAVALTIKDRPHGWRRYLGIAVTLVFNLITGILFFASMGQVLPFYEEGVLELPWIRRY